MLRVDCPRVVAGGAWVCLAVSAAACSSSSSQRNVILTGGSAGDAAADATGGTSGGGSGGNSGGAGGTSGGGSGGTSGGTGGTSATDASGGASGSDAGDAPSDAPSNAAVRIQRIQDGAVAVGQTARIEKVFVTVFRQTVGGELSFTVQEPQGESPTQYTYPEYAGIGVLVRVDGGAVTPPAVGDCLDVLGTVEEFQGRTQLTDATFNRRADCGTFPAPFEIPNFSVSFADVATDSDPNAAGNQPGTKAEVYESVLVRVTNVRVISVASAVRFQIAQQASPAGPSLIVQGVYHSQDPVVDQQYAAVTGIMSDASGEYRLLPRSASDFFQ